MRNWDFFPTGPEGSGPGQPFTGPTKFSRAPGQLLRSQTGGGGGGGGTSETPLPTPCDILL